MRAAVDSPSPPPPPPPSSIDLTLVARVDKLLAGKLRVPSGEESETLNECCVEMCDDWRNAKRRPQKEHCEREKNKSYLAS